MPRIYVDFSGLSQIGRDCKQISSKVDTIQSEFQNTIRHLDWDIRFESNINSTANQISRKLERYSRILCTYQQFISEAHAKYIQLNEYMNIGLADRMFRNYMGLDPSGWHTGPDGKPDLSYIDILKDIIITKPYICHPLISLISPVTGLLYITSGIPFGNKPSFFDHTRTPSVHASTDWLGYEFKDENPGITAWLGKVEADAQNEWGYAGVNGYLGKVESEIKADFDLFKTTTKTKYIDGKWVETRRTDFIAAELEAGVTASVLSGDVKAGVGSDMLGLEGNADCAVGSGKIGGKGEFSIGEDGINANLEGKAMVAAVEGTASGSINILGLEIKGEVSGYAGALGIEGQVGIEDNKIVLQGGAAAILGCSAGIEIGLNDEGWNNFIDFIVFWD